ncbi:MAG TPA: hypothetical protein VH500_15885 [Nitrososphaeraceae archaeon]|jgi:hypothetical protein
MKSTKLLSKIRKYMIEHPIFATIGLGLAITVAIGATISLLDPQQAFAKLCMGCPFQCSGVYCN